ncbi:MAG: hypothetical protein JWN17_2967, partial [Frankiales bacterium]|nr:hypothetical protein [Frankiales bacterium]
MDAPRPFTVTAVLAAVGFAVEGVLAVVHPVGDTDWDAAAQLLNAAFAVGVLAFAVALPYLARWLEVGAAGHAAVRVCQLGAALMVVESAVSSLNGGTVLGGLFLGGVLLMTVGLLTLGVSGLRAGVQRWAALLPFAGWVASIAGGDAGGAVLLAAVVLGLHAAVERDRPRRRRTRLAV